MTRDPFAEAARAEAVRWWQTPASSPGNVIEKLGQHMAEWARTHLAAQEPTDAEVEAAARKVFEADAPSHEPHEWFEASEALRSDYRGTARAALSAARAARRDEETQ